MNNKLVKPKAIGLQWVWVCKECETPIIVANRRYFWACSCHIRPTPLALDGGDSAASEQLSTPEVLSTLQGESTPARRK
jgi:hypothetical protein